jgi:TetR/AcrR family transcriptional regulator, transcriptional repressor for nem operon
MDATSRDQILDVAQALAQTRGFSGFSYRDVAVQVGIRAPSIHYHFPSKDDLGTALVERYRARFRGERAKFDRHASPAERLKRYVGLFRQPLVDADKMCLCGMFAAEFAALPEAMKNGVQGFFDENEAWLAELLEEGRKEGKLAFDGTSNARAGLVLSTLEGAMLAARVARNVGKFDAIASSLLAGLRP